MKRKTNKKPLLKLHKQARRHARMAFVPHKANQFRPLLIRRYGLLAVLLLVFGLQITYNLSTTGSVLGRTSVIDTNELLAQTNEERTKARLPTLARSASLDTAASMKAGDMLTKQYWAHTAPDGAEPWHWFAEAGYDYAAAGENLAKNFRSAEATTAAWMNSEGHRENILSGEYTEVGFSSATGKLDGKSVTVTVAHYGRPAGVLAAANTQPATVAITTAAASPMARVGVALQSLTPAALASIVLLLVVAVIALLAHTYRQNLPKVRRASWYRHHGLIKTGIITGALVVTVLLYSGGQI